MSEPDVNDLLTVERAIAILDAVEVSPRVVSVELTAADGLVLAEDLQADRDAPPFRKSLMDGYAVRSKDVSAAPVRLRVVGETAAGAPAARHLAAGETISIMTGAPLPDGADGVVPVEFTERDGDAVRILESPTPGRFIAERGSDARFGAVVLPRGTALGPASLAVAAGIGAIKCKAFARPRVAILATGNEIVPLEARPTESEIRNSNSTLLAALLRRLHCQVTDFGIVGDERNVIRSAIERAIVECDALFITGGMSMGEYDYVPRVLAELGADLKISKLRVKPGKPFVFATLKRPGTQNGVFCFGLPGNPVSGFVCTIRLASRLLRRMGGRPAADPAREAILASALAENGPREFYQPAIIGDDGRVTPLAWKGSADIYTLAKANVLIVREENAAAIEAGGRVRVLEIPT